MKDSYTVTVTQEDVDLAVDTVIDYEAGRTISFSRANSCPIANAFRREHGLKVGVGTLAIVNVYDDHTFLGTLEDGPEAKKFVELTDADEKNRDLPVPQTFTFTRTQA